MRVVYFCVLIVVFCATPILGVDEKSEIIQSDQQSKAVVGVELGGAALIYSVFGSLRLHEKIAVNVGVSYFGGTDRGVPLSLLQFPVSISGLFGPGSSYLEVLGGFDPTWESSSSTGATVGDSSFKATLYPEVGVGYRYWRKSGGFHFRAILYFIHLPGGGFIRDGWWPMPGIGFGYAFN